MTFRGFTTDTLVGLPPELFAEVIPAITLPSELKVTLHIFYRLSRTKGPAPRRVSYDELQADQTLRRGLRAISKVRPSDDLLREGIDAGVARGTLLHVVAPEGGRAINWYLICTEANRAWATQIGAAGVALGMSGAHMPDERPPLIALYEQNIGLVTPLLLDELREAAENYPDEWVADAIREAVRSNARSWRYIRKVLERWAANGRDSQGTPERPINVEKYTGGAYGDLFRRGSDTSDL